MNVATNLLLAAALVGAFCLLFLVVPSCQTTFFRNRLWRIRDDLADDVRAGRFADHREVANELYRHIDIVIRFGADLSPAKVTLFHVFSIGVEKTESWDENFSVVKDDDDRERLKEHYKRVRSAMVFHFYGGSPSGWLLFALVTLLTPLVVIVFVVMRLLRLQFRGATESLRDSVEVWGDRAYESQVEALPQLTRVAPVLA